jgi:hypothetical protein
MLFGKFNTLLQKAIFDGWIVSQGAKDCDRPGFRRFLGQLDGIFDSETEPHVSC